MGVIFFLIFVVGLCAIAKEITKGMADREQELDSLRSEDEKHNSRIRWGRGYETFKKK